MFFSDFITKITGKSNTNHQNQALTYYNQQLIEAIKVADVAKVKLALEAGANPNACDDQSEPAILLAAISKTKSAELIHALLTHSGIKLNLEQKSPKDGWTALMAAVSMVGDDNNNHKMASVNLLLAEGAKVNAKNFKKDTAYHIARNLGLSKLHQEIVALKKTPITVKFLDKQAYLQGKALTQNNYTKIPMEVLVLIGSFLYGKARLNNQFIPGIIKVKKKHKTSMK